MTRYIGCETARELLDEFLDGELPVDDQVLVEAHLRWCRTCRDRVEDMALIGGALRSHATVSRAAGGDERTLAALSEGVLERVRRERVDALSTRLRELFTDMRLLWPAIGATAALLVCVVGAFSVLQATSDEHPDSLAAMIAMMSDPGSDLNPLRPDMSVAIPRALDAGPMLDVAEDEAVFALRTVVTREGRISTAELLHSDRVPGSREARTAHDREVAELLDAVNHSRFEPAQALTGRKVAVNMVWVIARTTVKGSAREVDVLVPVAVPVRSQIRKTEVPEPVAPKPVAGEPVTIRESVLAPSATA